MELSLFDRDRIMSFYNIQHELYCGIDLHAKRMYTCIVDGEGKTVFHKNLHSLRRFGSYRTFTCPKAKSGRNRTYD